MSRNGQEQRDQLDSVWVKLPVPDASVLLGHLISEVGNPVRSGTSPQVDGSVEDRLARCTRLLRSVLTNWPESAPERPGRPGEWTWIAAGLDSYHAVNLREALKLVPDTGDWHGSLRAACEIVLKDDPGARPNQTAEHMKEHMP